MALKQIVRRPNIDGQQMEMVYYRETDIDPTSGAEYEVARHPVAYRLLPDGGWIENPALVETVMHALFERDGLAGMVWPIINEILPQPGEDGSVSVPVIRLDVGSALVVGINATNLSEEEVEEYGALVAAALYDNFPDEISAGRLAVVWSV